MSDATRQLAASVIVPSVARGGPRRVTALAVLAAAAGCARFGFESLDLPGVDAGIGGALVTTGSGGADATVTPTAGAAGAAASPGDCSDRAQNGDESGVDCGGRCAPCVCTLGAPERLRDPNRAGNDLWSPKLSSDGSSLYFAVTVPGFAEQIAVATRPDRAAPFGLGQALPAPINQAGEGTPYLSLDGRALYFYSSRPGGVGSRDLYVATRRSAEDEFDLVTPLSSLNGSALDYQPWLSPDERIIYFASGPASGNDIFRATRASTRDDFGAPELVVELSSGSDEGGITLSSDGLEVILASNRPGSAGARDLFLATRASTNEPFSQPQPLDALNTSENEIDPSISPDGSELYFASNRGGDSEIYRVARSCRP